MGDGNQSIFILLLSRRNPPLSLTHIATMNFPPEGAAEGMPVEEGEEERRDVENVNDWMFASREMREIPPKGQGEGGREQSERNKGVWTRHETDFSLVWNSGYRQAHKCAPRYTLLCWSHRTGSLKRAHRSGSSSTLWSFKKWPFKQEVYLNSLRNPCE